MCKRAKTRVWVVAEIQNCALRAHCVHGIPVHSEWVIHIQEDSEKIPIFCPSKTTSLGRHLSQCLHREHHAIQVLNTAASRDIIWVGNGKCTTRRLGRQWRRRWTCALMHIGAGQLRYTKYDSDPFSPCFGASCNPKFLRCLGHPVFGVLHWHRHGVQKDRQVPLP